MRAEGEVRYNLADRPSAIAQMFLHPLADPHHPAPGRLRGCVGPLNR